MIKSVKVVFVLLALLIVSTSSTVVNDDPPKYEETWESLFTVNNTPDWFLDAKFGIYCHWGPVSKALEGGDPTKFYSGWHGMRMYEDGTYSRNSKPSNNYLLQKSKYGNLKKNGYEKIIEDFDPSAFDAKTWAKLFALSGAQFAGPVAMHHDNFAMWDSKATRWNSVNYGGIDVSAELKREIEAVGLKYMASFHHAFTWQYFYPAHRYGGVKPDMYDLYTDHTEEDMEPTDRFHEEWWAKLKEYIDIYQPDLIWFDWWLENLSEDYRKKFLAYYYNKGIEWGKDVAVCYKETTFPKETAIYDYERGRPNQPLKQVWLTDTSPGAWFYKPGAKFVTPNDLIDILVDIVAKNGCMLLNVPPDPDGTIPQEMVNLLTKMGEWLNINGEAIYGTRVWTVFGEGPTRMPAGGHKVEKLKIEYTNTDIRFTKKSETELFAIVMDKPEDELAIKTLSSHIGALNSNIEKIELLGSDEEIKWERTTEGLVIKAPESYPSDYAHAFKIYLEGYREVGIGGGD